MVLKAKSKFYLTRNRFYLYVPMDIVKDSQFPFKAGETVIVDIKNKKMVVSK
ncbi:MAG: hypothetical protein HZB67_04060 [Candidatus Aenigmarchaeota archaeon]|nr:hypothetical protein [Candidatus Aenigmarchaeota archaeon]